MARLSADPCTVSFISVPTRLRPLLGRAVRAAACFRGRPYDVTVVLVSDQAIRRLNRTWRGVDRVTDIVSFLIGERPRVTGDLCIALGRSRAQARAQGHSWEKELAYLVIHGVLHLMGYTDYAPAERRRMFARQDRIYSCLYS